MFTDFVNFASGLNLSKNWIISHQSSSGAIFWDEKGKCDPWDHCECLIALANLFWWRLLLRRFSSFGLLIKAVSTSMEGMFGAFKTAKAAPSMSGL